MGGESFCHIDNTKIPTAISRDKKNDMGGMRGLTVNKNIAEAAKPKGLFIGGRDTSGTKKDCEENRSDEAVHLVMTPFTPREIRVAILRQDPGNSETTGTCQVFRSPLGIEFVFVLPQALQVVKVLSMPKHEGSQAAPERCQGPIFKPGKRCHSKVETTGNLLASHEA